MRGARAEDGVIRTDIKIGTAQTQRNEIRRRVRRQVMLRRLRHELAQGKDLTTILRRPYPTEVGRDS